MKHLFSEKDGIETVHYDGPNFGHYLCSDPIMIADRACMEVEGRETTRDVDCVLCLWIVEHVKGGGS